MAPPIYNPPPVSGGGTSNAVPLVVASGVTFTIPTNTQVLFATQIVINAGGTILITAGGQLVGVT